MTNYAFLSFPVKNLDRVVTAGSETGATSTRYAFLWNDSRAAIQQYNGVMNDLASAVAILPYRYGVVGYAAAFNPNASVAHTYLGVHGTSGTVAIYVTMGATSAQVQNALWSANIVGAVQLDGGSSAQLRCGNLKVQSSGRNVPHVILTQAAPR